MTTTSDLARYASKFAALGHEARLGIVRLLLSAHPEGLVAGQIQEELGIPPSTLSHHLDGLRQEGLIEPRREGKHVRYLAAEEGLRDLLGFLYAECCTRSRLIPVSAFGRASQARR